MFFLILLTLIS
ncbi:hypothetical protein LINPERPRIM_LOCUS2602 [Linum perenne]